MADLKKLIFQVSDSLEHRDSPPEEEELLKLIRAYACALNLTEQPPFSETEIDEASRRIQTLFDIRMGLGTIFEAEDYRPWLTSRQGDIDWYYWQRYKNHLKAKGFPPHVVRTLDAVTDKILDHLENPEKEGHWARRGLVVGHVQSGKTANYTGLICKAADAGYKVIIILAGLLNALRNQTQERIDADFMGWCTKTKKHIGAARFSAERRPVCFTTSFEDFRRSTATSISMELAALKEPVILVLKKNKSTLENLYGWLAGHNRHNLKNFPMLLIDDEADHASINTNKEDNDPTAINRAIRNLLALFPRSSFVGYTATPFANIFIDPENEDEMANGELYRDLFPRDFILSLDPPDNYVGADRLFNEDGNLDCIRTIDDNEDLLPIRHKISFVPSALPTSLKDAIDGFIIAKAIRLLCGHHRSHHSMMVNASRFTAVQDLLKDLVLEHVKGRRQAINNFGGLTPIRAIENSAIRRMHEIWETEYSAAGCSWPQVLSRLKESVDPINVVSINSKSTATLDYSPLNYPDGRSLIAVGGLGLSRGLTLEGLIATYFLRNSIMYDTLMQMGRWFGYRDGYAHLCRIYMTADAEAWYSHVADAIDELRDDFKAMERARLTPMEFGLRVRSHPTALIVTARNKMRSSREVPVNISLEGRLAETSVVLGERDVLSANRAVLEAVVLEASAGKPPEPAGRLGWLWRGVGASIVKAAIEQYQNHPECLLTYPEPLLEYIDWLSKNRCDRFDVLLRTGDPGPRKEVTIGGVSFPPITRTVAELSANRIEFKRRRIASRGDERAGLSDEEVRAIKENYSHTHPGKDVPDKEYRKFRAEAGRPPLFMIMFAAIRAQETGPFDTVVPAFGIGFPGDPGSSRRPEKLVQYRVNTVWWQKHVLIPDEQDGEEE